MPISGPTSFLSTSDEFISHWGLANTTLGAGNEIVLIGGITLAMLVANRDALVAKRTALASKLNLAELARGDVEDRKTTLLAWASKFNDRVRALYSGKKWERALPVLPSITDGEGPFGDPMEDVATLWELLNLDATLPDLILVGGVTQAQFATERSAMRSAFSAWKAAVKVANFTLEERNDIQDVLYPIFKEYRKAVPGHFEKGAAPLDSLPDLTPAPGSTPAPVQLSGGWDEQLDAVVLNVTQPTEPNVTIQIRACDGPTYNADTENVVATLPAGTFTVTNNFNMPNPGDEKSFRAYTINATGNEKGSNTVTVVRPENPTTPPTP
jgi:hypothetical protein